MSATTDGRAATTPRGTLREEPALDAGLASLEDGRRVDFARLRAERLARCLAEMRRDGLDALLLGSEANARYVTGARRLWVGGTRPFAPGCVVLADGDVHLMNTWDDGVPAEIPRGHLFGPSWNPQRYAEVLAAIPALRRAQRVGIDAMSPLMETLVTAALPDALLVDAGPAMRRARQVKTADELACITIATAAAESCVSWALSALRPGVTEAQLFARWTERLGQLGLTIPTTQSTVFVTAPPTTSTDADHVPLRTATDRSVKPGDLVAFDTGLLYAGYEGSVAGTWACPGGRDVSVRGHRRLAARAAAVLEALLATCRPGAVGQDVLGAYEAAGETLPSLPVLVGIGLGVEQPVVGAHLPVDAGASTSLVAGMVVGLQAYVSDERAGHLERRVVLVSEGGAMPLTRTAREDIDAPR